MNIKKYKDKKQYRYKGYDYSQNGLYFITICIKNRQEYFGDIVNDIMNLSVLGRVTEKCWLEIPKHFPFVLLDEFVIMPNHIHGILEIFNNNIVGTQDFAFLHGKNRKRKYKNQFAPQSKNLASIIRGFKIGVTKFAKNNNLEFRWQGRFHDRIIRNQNELDRIKKYILDNPLKWKLDRNNPLNLYM